MNCCCEDLPSKWMMIKDYQRVIFKLLKLASVSGLVKELMGKNSKYSNLFVEHVHEIANGIAWPV